MTFKDLSRDFLAAAGAVENLRRVAERRWNISDRVEAWISVSGWDDTVRVSVQANLRQYGTCYTDALTATELRQIAAIKDLADRWQRGELAELPAETPIEIVQLR